MSRQATRRDITIDVQHLQHVVAHDFWAGLAHSAALADAWQACVAAHERQRRRRRQARRSPRPRARG